MADNDNRRTLPILFDRHGLIGAVMIVETSLPNQEAVIAALREALSQWVIHTDEGAAALDLKSDSLTIDALILDQYFDENESPAEYLREYLEMSEIVVRYVGRTTAMPRPRIGDNVLTEGAKGALQAREQAYQKTLANDAQHA